MDRNKYFGRRRKQAMKYENDFEHLQLREDTALSLGKFDGLHRGHGLLLDIICEKKNTGLKSAVFTFQFPTQNGKHKVITTSEEKKRILQERGIDYLIECPFTKSIMEMEAEQFIEEAVRRLRVKWMAVGTDFRFGHNRRGDYHMLQNYASKYGYQLSVVPKMQHGEEDISSTCIRREIEAGHMELVHELLGYPYFIEGTITHGRRIGRTIGFPTINLQPLPEKILPPLGVYLSNVILDEKQYNGITNIGKKPTIHGNRPAGAETFIYDFNGDVYGKRVRVNILRFVRPERKFEGIEQLREQLSADISYGRKYFNNAFSLDIK